MKNKISIIFIILFITISFVSARDTYRSNNNIPRISGQPKLKAGCSPAVNTAILELNNIRTIIEGTGGSMFQDRSNNRPFYQVPKTSSSADIATSSIYSGGLWMAGEDVNGQLKLAAAVFRSGGKNDFWPGPLDLRTAENNQETCNLFDKHYRISKKDVIELRLWYSVINDPNRNLKDVGLDGYSIPRSITEYPGNSGLSNIFSQTLAPFFDRNGDGFYDPEDGDYPYFEFDTKAPCGTDRSPRLYGDETIFFVFNDKGNAHTETNAPSIGMEIHGQAFAFATDDEVNNMTFYNYRMLNRSVFTLTNTYFAQFCDTDLGFPDDDFVGSDVSRGLAYTYNGDSDDDRNGNTNAPGYGRTPPAIGIDFFQGPYLDNDNIDNPLTTNIQDAIDSNGIPYRGIGIGYGDGFIDNERYGMRKFLYFNRTGTGNNWNLDPTVPAHFYNYMTGVWRDGSSLLWGGQGHISSSTALTPCDYLFPGDSDPLYWSSRGVAVTPVVWTEETEKNRPGDRRMLQSAGPFTLNSGAVNDLTVGIVWARASTGSPFESVKELLRADDKAQLLFDNCFKIIEGPDAPIITAQEMDKEIILYIENPELGNNFNELYSEIKPDIIVPDTIDGRFVSNSQKQELKKYKFQGYQIYQAINSTVSSSNIGDLTKARLIAQCDIQDNVANIINYVSSDVNGVKLRVPIAMVSNAENQGIRHSFRIDRDLFTTTADPLLVNHKTYYYFAIAYGYNQYKEYDPIDPNKLDGQREPYIRSRKRGDGQSVTPIAVTPHNPSPEKNGTVSNGSYGETPQITRVDGIGNDANQLEITEETEQEILKNGFVDNVVYKKGFGPVSVKVIDPLNVKPGIYYLKFNTNRSEDSLEFANWVIYDKNNPKDTIATSDRNIQFGNEQIISSHGISIQIEQPRRLFSKYYDSSLVSLTSYSNGFISASIEAEEPSKRWLDGLQDQEGISQRNWILSGDLALPADPATNTRYEDRQPTDGVFLDPDSDFEQMLGGTWAPYALVAPAFSGSSTVREEPYSGNRPGLDLAWNRIRSTLTSLQGYTANILSSVDLVITKDKDKWSRAPVFESHINRSQSLGGVSFMNLRSSQSVDKEGNPDNSGTTGMGWFPGYAINLETGERLNIAFAEDSWYRGENGADMLWNPTSNESIGIDRESVFGGKHFVYIFSNDGGTRTNRYDEGKTIYNQVEGGSISNISRVFSNAMYAGVPLLREGRELLETEVRIKFRVERRFQKYNTAANLNNGLPMYEIDMNSVATSFSNQSAQNTTKSLINVVPNPYYGYSSYEISRLDNKVKIINIPEQCKVSIYSGSGTLVKYFNKSDELTSLEWDLRNEKRVLVSSGVYYIHIDGGEFGSKILKLVAIMKPTDITAF